MPHLQTERPDGKTELTTGCASRVGGRKRIWRSILNDKELADRVVAHGIKRPAALFGHPQPTNYALVRDWQVAGALIERCEAHCVDWDDLEPRHWRHLLLASNTPRAIIEACCEALDG